MFVHAGPGTRVGSAVDSIISPGVVVSGSHVSNSVLSPGVRLNSWSSVSDSVIMDEVSVGRHCQIHRAIIDKNVRSEEHTSELQSRGHLVCRLLLEKQN